MGYSVNLLFRKAANFSSTKDLYSILISILKDDFHSRITGSPDQTCNSFLTVKVT